MKVPYPLLAPVVLVLCFIGAYGVRNSVFDIWVTIGFGVVGYLMQKLRFPAAPVVLALILAPMMEAALRQSLIISNGSPGIFVSRPMSLSLLVLAVASIALSIYTRMRAAQKTKAFIDFISE